MTKLVCLTYSKGIPPSVGWCLHHWDPRRVENDTEGSRRSGYPLEEDRSSDFPRTWKVAVPQWGSWQGLSCGCECKYNQPIFFLALALRAQTPLENLPVSVLTWASLIHTGPLEIFSRIKTAASGIIVELTRGGRSPVEDERGSRVWERSEKFRKWDVWGGITLLCFFCILQPSLS